MNTFLNVLLVILIVVGVALETFRELEAQLTVRNYKNYLK